MWLQDAGLSRAHNRNCPPLTPTTEVVVAAIGTHSDNFVATHDASSVSASCSGYTRDVDDPATSAVDEAAMTPVPSSLEDCERPPRSGTWDVQIVPFVAPIPVVRTCADIYAAGIATVAFDCSTELNALDASPAGITCAADPCAAAECCTTPRATWVFQGDLMSGRDSCTNTCAAAGVGCTDGDWGIHDQASLVSALDAAGVDATTRCTTYDSGAQMKGAMTQTASPGGCHWSHAGTVAQCSATTDHYFRLCRCDLP